MKIDIEKITTTSQLFVAWSIALGAVLVLLYCIDIEFYPKGIEIGDGLFFIWTALAFGGRITITTLVFSSIGLSLYSCIAKLVSLFKTLPNAVPKPILSIIWPIHVLSFFVVFTLSVIQVISIIANKAIPNIDVEYWIAMFSALFINGIILAYLLEGKYESKNKIIFNLIFMFLLFFIPMIFVKGFGYRVINLSIQDLGIKTNNVSLFLNQDSSTYVNNMIDKGQYEAYLIPLNNGVNRLDNAEILFQGIGNVSRIKVSTNSDGFFLDLPSESFVVAKELSPKKPELLSKLLRDYMLRSFNKHEIQFNTDNYTLSFSMKYSEFGVGSSKIPMPFESVLKEITPKLLEFLNQHQELVKSIEVVGYASSDWKASDGQIDAYVKNHHLAIDRSKSVVDLMYKTDTIVSQMSSMINKINIKGVSSNLSPSGNSRTVEIRIIPRFVNKENQS